jgi:hypothetical protein
MTVSKKLSLDEIAALAGQFNVEVSKEHDPYSGISSDEGIECTTQVIMSTLAEGKDPTKKPVGSYVSTQQEVEKNPHFVSSL